MDRDKFGRFLKGGNLGKKHWAWKEDKVGYEAIHAWVNRNFKKEKCFECGCTENLDYANISGEYKRNINDWKVMCKKHHHIFDDVYNKMMKTRAENGSRFAKGNKPKYKCMECGEESFGHPKSQLCKKHFYADFRKTHSDHLKEYKRKWYLKNREKLLQKEKERYAIKRLSRLS